MKRLTLTIAIFCASLLYSNAVLAVGIKVAPLEYRTTLEQGQKKKGFIDISNPGTTSQVIQVSTAAFRQIDDNGKLEFYEDEGIKKGILTDLDEFELGPREALRMYFILDGNALPAGDVYGAIFFTTESSSLASDAGTSQQIRVGTLFSIVNGTPSSRQASITKLNISSVQFSDTLTGTYTIKNTGDPKKTTGFYPTVQLQILPFGESKSVQSSLVFAERSRSGDFSIKSPQFGIYKVSASYADSKQSRYVLVLQPLATLGVIMSLVAIGGLVYWITRRRSPRFNKL